MDHDFSLILTFVGGLTAALLFGLIARKLHLSPLVGYLLAGVVVGPYSPGFVADSHTVEQFAELGVILLMFGVGLHFHLKDLIAVQKVAVPGAVVQISVATVLGVIVGWCFGWSTISGLVFGMAISVASTVVLTGGGGFVHHSSAGSDTRCHGGPAKRSRGLGQHSFRIRMDVRQAVRPGRADPVCR